MWITRAFCDGYRETNRSNQVVDIASARVGLTPWSPWAVSGVAGYTHVGWVRLARLSVPRRHQSFFECSFAPRHVPVDFPRFGKRRGNTASNREARPQ